MFWLLKFIEIADHLTGDMVFAAKSYNKNARVSLKAALNETKTKVALNETRRGERLYLNPLLDTPEPSHCDLTPKYCDLQCCSDKASILYSMLC
jgi:hypothetical protein